jgi:beta-lactam-binding protein with PASTA domain
MRTKRHQVLARLLVSSLLITGVQVSMTTTWAATIKNGDACSPAGATFKQGATEFVCTKSGSKVVWKSKKKASPSATPEAKFTMPRVVGMNLQLAQDLLQSKGSYILDQVDHKGLLRIQVLDSNGKVCKQTPSAGKVVLASTVVTLSSVKLTERC